MQLTKDQTHQFREDGYIWFEDFFTQRETKALRVELGRIYDTGGGARVLHFMESPALPYLKKGTGINCAVQEDGTKRNNDGERQNLQVIPLLNRSDFHTRLTFPRQLARSPRGHACPLPHRAD